MAEDAVSAWFKAAGRISLLTAAEELHLARRVQRWQNHPEPVPRNIERSGQRARDRMIQANLRLVVSVGKKFAPRLHGTGLQMEDLLQEGVIGLARGVEKFDPERGYKFSTMGYWWIRQAMGRITDAEGMLRTPSSATQLLRRWRWRPEGQSIADFSEEWGYDPTKIKRELEHAARAKVGSLDCIARDDDNGSTAIGELVAAEETCTLEGMDFIEAVTELRDEHPDAMALLELQADGAKLTDIAELQGCTLNQLKTQLSNARATLKTAAPTHVAAMMGAPITAPIAVLDRPDYDPSPLLMSVELPSTNGHNAQALEACLEQPSAKPRRKRRTAAEIAAERAAQAPAVAPGVLTMTMAGAEIKGGPAELAALLREMNRAA